MLRKEVEKMYTPEDIFEFNLVYCDRIVKNVMARVFLSSKWNTLPQQHNSLSKWTPGLSLIWEILSQTWELTKSEVKTSMPDLHQYEQLVHLHVHTSLIAYHAASFDSLEKSLHVVLWIKCINLGSDLTFPNRSQEVRGSLWKFPLSDFQQQNKHWQFVSAW